MIKLDNGSQAPRIDHLTLSQNNRLLVLPLVKDNRSVSFRLSMDRCSTQSPNDSLRLDLLNRAGPPRQRNTVEQGSYGQAEVCAGLYR